MNDYSGDFDNDNFMGDDSFEDSFDENHEPEDCFDADREIEDGPDEAEFHEDDFTAEDAFFFGGAMGFAYEEGLEEAERRKLEKEMEDESNRDLEI
ncbi:MAG: hypothetical protein Q8P24_06295 [Desulfobacterales bacterium]|nr:hypothetical protein [Desulfobacterales bacterium]